MNASAMERLTLENGLRLALDKKELFLVYQPQMDIATGKITGLEALLRWQQQAAGAHRNHRQSGFVTRDLHA